MLIQTPENSLAAELQELYGQEDEMPQAEVDQMIQAMNDRDVVDEEECEERDDLDREAVDDD